MYEILIFTLLFFLNCVKDEMGNVKKMVINKDKIICIRKIKRDLKLLDEIKRKWWAIFQREKEVPSGKRIGCN